MVEPIEGWSHGAEPSLGAAISTAQRLRELQTHISTTTAAIQTVQLAGGQERHQAVKALHAAEIVLIREMVRLSLAMVPPLQ